MPKTVRGNLDADQLKLKCRLGDTTVVQMADTTAAFTAGHMLVFGTDGSSIDGGAPGGGVTWVREVPSGTLNGTNKVFTLAHTPTAGSLEVFLNVMQSLTADYTLSGATITFVTAPKASDAGWFFAEYTH
jgi:hypothetical protein